MTTVGKEFDSDSEFLKRRHQPLVFCDVIVRDKLGHTGHS